MTAAAPNILLFMVDQLTAFALKAYGGTVCKTPNLDRLAARGVVFENAYCPYPLCAPSRFAMMAGRLPSRIGAFDNGAEFTASTPTFAHYLRLRGYYTCIAGKMHFVGPDQHHGFEERLTTEIYPADFSWTPVAGYKDGNPDDERRYAAGVSTIDTILDAGPKARTMQIDYDEEVVHRAVRELYARARSGDGRPFLLTVSLTHPHDPYAITRAYWERYTDSEIDAPRVGFVPLDERDPHSRSLYFHYGQDKTEITSEAYRRARRGYYGMISYVDDLFGQVMAALEGADFAENTVVLFTSDHGDMIGERGMWFKKTLFEPAIRVPLIIAHPGRSACREPAPVSLVDVLPTLLELTGTDAEAIRTPLDGRSLAPALDGGRLSGPVFVEHIDGGTAAPRVMVREGAMKLVYSRAYPSQFYDLAADPDELDNLAGSSDYAEIEARLTALVEETWGLEALAEEVSASQKARKLIDAALGQGRRERWDFVPRLEAESQRYVRHGDAFPDVERRGYLPYGSD
ncbi:MAG: choline-sulfatase [Kiloniellales bacterium]|nr:choline-sulfatase [Kiloniellales bacterium]